MSIDRDPRYAWQVVAMLWSISFFNYADRQAIFSVFPLLENVNCTSTPCNSGCWAPRSRGSTG